MTRAAARSSLVLAALGLAHAFRAGRGLCAPRAATLSPSLAATASPSPETLLEWFQGDFDNYNQVSRLPCGKEAWLYSGSPLLPYLLDPGPARAARGGANVRGWGA
jgi:hypothetical protein